MRERQDNLPGYPQSEADMVSEALRRPLAEKIESAIGLLQLYEPKALELSSDGYWLAYSGGKDSECILELARMAGVKHRTVYNVTTIDPPELVRFIKREHPEVRLNRPSRHLLTAMQDRTIADGPPLRHHRWCCAEYKERGGNGMGKVIGVRIAESQNRAKLWRGIVPHRSGLGFFVCPLCYWTDRDVWAFHRLRNLPHCCLYDQGYKRLGCIACPSAKPSETAGHFARWPRYQAMWRRAIVKYWEDNHNRHRKNGEPLYCAAWPTGEAFWQWWISGKRQGPRQTCQGEFLFGGDSRSAEEDVT